MPPAYIGLVQELRRRILRRDPGWEAHPGEHADVIVAAAPATEISPDPAAYGAVLLAEAREEVSRADQKASILLAAAGVAIGAMLGGMVSVGWSPPGGATVWLVLWWVGSGLALAGVVTLAGAIYPRTRAERGGDRAEHLFYFEHAAGYGSTEGLEAALRSSAVDPLHRVSHQLFHVSRVVARKYRLIRQAIWLLLLGAGCSLVAVLQPHL